MTKNTTEPSPKDYDTLLERVLSLEMYIEKNGLDVPEPYIYPKLLHVAELLYGDIQEMIFHSRKYPMGIETYHVLKKFQDNIENLNVTSERIRWFQKPTKWPSCIREWIAKNSFKKYQKQSQEDSYGN